MTVQVLKGISPINGSHRLGKQSW
ncbi:conserved protein of unknown function [Ralstonia solanacearum CFBP2957]|nr:conserved protein of unknown function [Ralstonia solanacearum CFBP2957]